MRIKINAVVLSINEKAVAGTAPDKTGPVMIEELMKLPSDVKIISLTPLFRGVLDGADLPTVSTVYQTHESPKPLNGWDRP